MTTLFIRRLRRLSAIFITCELAGATTFLIGCHRQAGNTVPAAPISDTAPAGTRIFHLDADGSKIELLIDPGKLNVSDAAIQRWVNRSAKALDHYFGRFPVKSVRIEIAVADQGAVDDGMTTDQEIRVTLGSAATPADLDNDWIMVHEMFHLAFPDLDDRYLWIQEGLASYLEPFARARVGTISVDQVWRDLYEGLPQGQPMPGDKGLNNTHTQGRTYWGGSIFCFLADVKIREQTHGRRSLDDAMRAVLNQGGDRYVHWSMDRVLDVCDRATGTTVLRDLYNEQADKPVTVDLDALWKRMGVKVVDNQVLYDNSAPLAQIRLSMTR